MKWNGWLVIFSVLLMFGCGGDSTSSSSSDSPDKIFPQSLFFFPVPDGGWRHLHIDVPAGYDRLKVSSNPSGNTSSHMLVNHQRKANDQMITDGSADCEVEFDSSESKVCELHSPAAGRWYVSIRHLDGSSVHAITAVYDKQISLHAGGAVAGATVDPGNASFVNNGVTDGGHWSGNVDDMVWIDFGQEYKITEIKVYADLVGNVPLAISLLDTDTEGLEESPPDLYFIIDGMSWTTSAGNECRGLTFSSGSLTCTMGSGWPDSRAIFVLLDPGSGSQSGDEVEIREIEVHGWLRNP